MAEQKKDVTIVCFSGDFDKILAAFTMATGAAATNRKVTGYFECGRAFGKCSAFM